MCGIAGIIAGNNNSLDLEGAAFQMMSALEHRGPDCSGHYLDKEEQLLLVHRRLSVQDLTEAGKQPMFSRQGRYSVVFNGEIYNFKLLAKELEICGHWFYGHSDTEVLLAAIETWGVERALGKFIGMFAFALWDADEKELYLCRDRFGEKPLYYGWVAQGFYFASELKAIECVVPESALEMDQQSLTEYFKYGFINAPKSIYRDIYKLPPSTYFKISRKKVNKRGGFSPYADEAEFGPHAYWSLLEVANKGISTQIGDERDAIEELDKLLRDTVSMQTIADVSVGTFLSGGIDSSLVSAVAQAETSRNIKTFTIGFEEVDYDESKYAERIAGYLGTDHRTEYVSAQDALEVVPKLNSIYDEPFADASQIPTYLVSRIARKNVTVCLSGDGGDELFGGYNRYTWSESIWRRAALIPRPVRRVLASIMQSLKPGVWDLGYRLLASGASADRMGAQRMVGLKLQKLAEFITEKSLEDGYQYLLSFWNDPDQLLNLEDAMIDTAHINESPNTKEFIHRAMYWDQINYLPGDNLAKVDRASMAVSLETRLPLLSHQIAELSWRIPRSMKVRNGHSKWLLKQVLYKYVPRELIDRPKMGFSVPVAHWLRNELNEWAGDLLGSKRVMENSMLNQAHITRVWREHIKGERDHALKLWALLMFISWTEK